MQSSRSSSSGAIPIGRVARAHGIRGELRVEPYDAGSPTLATVSRLLLGGSEYVVVRARPVPAAFLLQVEGVVTRDQAEALRGAEVAAFRADVPVGAGEYLVEDLVGCAVFAPDGSPLGTVERLFWNGAHDVLELSDGRMVPLVDEWVSEVDLGARRIVVEPHDAF